MLRLYDFLDSGNGYKVRLVLNQLDIPYQRIETDIMAGASRSPEFLAMNPNGRIPLLETGEGEYLAESHAILFYLAEATPLLPGDRLERALVLQWMCFEQYNVEPNLAVARFVLRHLEDSAENRERAESKLEAGHAALSVMESHLATRAFFVGDAYSIADIALYGYVHVAGEGGFSLKDYGAVRDWIERVRAQPRHIPITQA